MMKTTIVVCAVMDDKQLISSPVTGLLERIDKGASSKFIIERQKSETDFLNSIRKVIK